MVLITDSGDYSQMIETYQADLVLFEFVEGHLHNIDISNFHNNNIVPKLAWMPIDSLSPTRGVCYSYIEKYQIETIFSPDSHIGEAFPEIKDKLFYNLHFIDSEINKDYYLEKNIPILLTGNFEKDVIQYTWRSKVKEPILNNFPALYYRHPGFDRKNISEILKIDNEKYFKSINSSYISPTCGSFKKAVVMKHLEIPGSMSCLIAEESEILKLYGFEDIKNCVFAEPENIVDKIQYLFNNPEELKQITQAGYDMVHTNHTYKNRSQMRDWYELNKIKTANQKIIQKDLFGKLELVDKSTTKFESIHLTGALDIKWITEIDEMIFKKQFQQAIAKCHDCLRYLPYMAEPKLRLALIYLLIGLPEEGVRFLEQILDFEIKFGKTQLIDPINLSVLILLCLALNETELAKKYSKLYLHKRRKELDVIRIFILENYANNEEEKFLAVKLRAAFNEKQNFVSIYYSYSKRFNFLNYFNNIIKIYLKGKIVEINFSKSNESVQWQENEIFKLNDEQVFEDIEILKTKKISLKKRIKRKLKTIISN